MTGRREPSRCSRCGEAGHNRRSCTKPAAPTSIAGRGKAAGAGEVAKAARACLTADGSLHEAAPLLVAIAERLARDVDEAPEVRDRVAATRALLDVVAALDVAPPAPPTGDVAKDGEPAGDESDNPLGIPAVPPHLGDAAQS